MHRRKFLELGLLGAAGLALPALEGCSRRSSAPPRSLAAIVEARQAAGARPGLDVPLAGGDYVAELPNYLAFGLVRTQGPPIAGSDAVAWLARSADPRASVGVQGPLRARWYQYGRPHEDEHHAEGPVQGINATEVRFDRPGIWTLLVEARTRNARLLGTSAIQVRPKGAPGSLIPGERALPSQTPTLDDHRGVEPICTRQPPCDMHRVTLADAVAAGKPVAFFVGTPRFCESRTCGPNLEELIAVQQEVGDRMTFVHAEVYKDDRTETVINKVVAPVFSEWRLSSEPWLFLIDRGGMIVSRFEGPLTAPQIRAATKPLLTGG